VARDRGLATRYCAAKPSLAIDEAGKYGDATAGILRNQAVIQLDDQNVLFVKNWRKREQAAV
jgi:hypothetical protein